MNEIPKNIKIDKNLSCSLHDDKNNKKILEILKSENRNWYHYTDVKKPESIEDVNKYTGSGKMFFDIFYKNNLIGMVEFNSEKNYLSYWLASKFHNKGIMSKILKNISDLFLELGLSEVFVHIQDENIASIRVAEKSGFKLKRRKVYDEDDIMLLFSKK